MSEVKTSVGGAIEDEAGRRFVDAWHRAERGESSLKAAPDSATTVRSLILRAVWPKAERLAAVVIARIKLRRIM